MTEFCGAIQSSRISITYSLTYMYYIYTMTQAYSCHSVKRKSYWNFNFIIISYDLYSKFCEKITMVAHLPQYLSVALAQRF